LLPLQLLLLYLQKQGRQPDFNSKAKDNQNRRSGLWIDSNNTPQWVLSYLMPGGCSNNSSGSSSYGSSSYNSYSSQGVVGGGGDAYMPQQASSQKEAEWMDVCRNYANYWDNRINVSAVLHNNYKQQQQQLMLMLLLMLLFCALVRLSRKLCGCCSSACCVGASNFPTCNEQHKHTVAVQLQQTT
jgi:hypothetical protein